MKIRKAKTKDLNACAKILMKEFNKQGQHWNLKNAKLRLEGFMFYEKYGRGANFVLEEDNTIVGFIFSEIFYYERDKTLWIGEFAIDSKYQGKGFGKQALEFLDGFARKQKVKQIILATSTKEKAIKLYKRMGFKETNFAFMEKNF